MPAARDHGSCIPESVKIGHAGGSRRGSRKSVGLQRVWMAVPSATSHEDGLLWRRVPAVEEVSVEQLVLRGILDRGEKLVVTVARLVLPVVRAGEDDPAVR